MSKSTRRKPVMECSAVARRNIILNAQLFAKCCKPFKKLFGVTLHEFWPDNVRGFRPDYLADWLEIPLADLKDTVELAYGKAGVMLLGVVARKITKPSKIEEIVRTALQRGREEEFKPLAD